MSGTVLLGPGEVDARDRIVEAVCPRPTLIRDITRLCLEHFLDRVVATAPLPPGPRLYLANHQTGFDLLFLAVTLAGLGHGPARLLVWDKLRLMQYGEMLMPLIERPDADDTGALCGIDLVAFDARLPDRTRTAIAAIAQASETKSIVAAAEGFLQQTEAQPTEHIATALLDLAVATDLPVVPVRIAWGLPEHQTGGRFCWPHRLSPLGVFLGPALRPAELATLPLPERRRRVGAAIDALRPPPPPGHALANAAMLARVEAIVARTGVTQTKAILQDLLLATHPARLTDEGQATRELLRRGQWAPLAHRDDWLARYALTLSDGMITTDLPFDALYPQEQPEPEVR
ncbi:MAG: hypothetical protein AAGI34_04705 [Pseudomonadota bacterium]